MIANDNITEISCLSDDFCKIFSAELKNSRLMTEKCTVINPVECWMQRRYWTNAPIWLL